MCSIRAKVLNILFHNFGFSPNNFMQYLTMYLHSSELSALEEISLSNDIFANPLSFAVASFIFVTNSTWDMVSFTFDIPFSKSPYFLNLYL